jgi:polyphosphate kinase
MARRKTDERSLFINREASWLAFNRRVLEEATDERNPLLERVKFLAITASNLDEFFEVRVAGLLQQIEDGIADPGPDGLTPQEQLALIREQTHDFVAKQYGIWNDILLPQLANEKIRVLELKDLTPEQLRFVEDYCEREVDPLLTPVTIDPAHPFPRVLNKALCLGLLLKRKRRAATYMGVMTVPRLLPRLVRLPSVRDGVDYIFLADLLAFHAARMYRGYDILSVASFRVTRNSNLYLEEEEIRNLLETVRTELHNRRKGDAVRLEIDADASEEIVERLRTNFELEPWQVFRTNGPVNLSRLFNFHELTDRSDLKYKSFAARELTLDSKSKDIFEVLRRRDILLHHPFDSYSGVVDFITTAAEDSRVVSLKQTIYRTSSDSPIGAALIEAAAEKDVTVVVELTARFDEASNIKWSRSMEDAGVQVFHGLVGLKTHAKLALLVRKDPDGVMRRYAHVGTGNYNHVTSRFYSDFSLLTADPQITEAIHAVFNYLTAYAERPNYLPLAVSPLNLAETSSRLIRREADHARAGRPARIIAKMNALLDRDVINELYAASQAGVDIDLIVRGMCGLRPGIPGISDNIQVRSIVGRFLEHSRAFYFLNGGQDEAYISSADWMPRNLYERAEVLCPVRDPGLLERLRDEILGAYLADNCKARLLTRSGAYKRLSGGSKKGGGDFSAQDFLIAVAEGRRKSLSEIALGETERKLPPSRQPAVQAVSKGTGK